MKLEGNLYPFYQKKPGLSYLLNHTWRIPDGKNPNCYTKLSIKIPCPKSAQDYPVIIATLHNSKRSFFLTFTRVEDLERVFNLQNLASVASESYENLKARMEQELKNAETARQILEKATKDIHDAAFSRND